MKLDVQNLMQVLTKKATYETLTQPVAWAEDEAEAKRVTWQMGQNVEGGDWSTSLLGIINGVLPEATGMVLVASIDDETGKFLGWSLRKVWW